MNILLYIIITVSALPQIRDEKNWKKEIEPEVNKPEVNEQSLSRKIRMHMEAQIYRLRNKEIIDTSNRTGELIAKYLAKLNKNGKRATINSPNHRRRSDIGRRRHHHQYRTSPNAQNKS